MINHLFLLLFFLTPFLVSPSSSELFELPKMYFVYLLTIIIATLHLVKFFKRQVPLFRRHFLNLPLSLFLLSQTISTLLSVDPHTSFFGYYSRLNGGLLSLICFSLLFFVLNVYLDQPLLKKILTTSLFSALLVSICAIAQHFGIDKSFWIQDVQSRVFSTFGQPNWLAAYLAIIIPLSLYQLNSSKKFSLFHFFPILFFLALLFTKSKSGIYATGLSLALFYFLSLVKKQKTNYFLIPLFILLAILVRNPIKDFLTPQRRGHSPTTINVTPSGNIRTIVWQGAIDLYRQFPLFGTGTETFAYSYYWVRPQQHNLTSEWDFLYNKAHNEYLNFLATTGTFGFLTYALLIIITLYHLFKKPHSALKTALLASYLSILITNFAGFSVVIVSLYFFLIPCFISISQKPSPQPKKPLFLPIFVTIIISLLLVKITIYYFLADLAYSQVLKLAQDQPQTAFKFIQSALYFRPKEPVYLSQAALLSAKLEKPQAAIDYSQSATHISPSNINLLKQRAQTFYYLSTFDSKYLRVAIDTLTTIAALAPTDAKTPYITGKFLLSADLKTEALPYLKKATQLKPNYDHAWYALGQIHFDQDQPEDAKASFENVLKINPDNADAQKYLDQINSSL